MPAPSRFSPPNGTPLGRSIAVIAAGFVVLCAAVVAVGWLITHPLADTMRHENAVNRWLAGERTDGLTHVADGGTLVGQTVTGLVVLALLGTAFALWRHTWWPLVFVVVVDAGLGLFYLAGTSLDPRRRPPVHILQSGLVADHSFPSGHTGTATAIGGALAALAWAYTRVARPLLMVLVVVPAYTMLSRVYVGAHHVSDVLAAFTYTVLWILLCARMLLPRRGGAELDQPRVATPAVSGPRRRQSR